MPACVGPVPVDLQRGGLGWPGLPWPTIGRWSVGGVLPEFFVPGVGVRLSDDQPGIFSGMESYPSFEDVCFDLGDKVTSSISRSAVLTAADLLDYRTIRPLWVSRSSERGLAGWLHDRMWVHLVDQLEEVSDVLIVDREPMREIFVGKRYRLRVKRHHPGGGVSTYPTQTALDFLLQDQQLAIEGLEEIRLITGYLWESDLRQVGVPVLSLRDGRDKVLWMRALPPAAGASGVVDLTPPSVVGPTAPTIEVGPVEGGESAPGTGSG